MKLKNILFTQEGTVCIRNIKLATALQNLEYNIHLAYWGKLPGDFYGTSNEIYTSIMDIGKGFYSHFPHRLFWISKIKNVCKNKKIDLIHCHNAPERLASMIINSKFNIPVVYDQHDFISHKKKVSKKYLQREKICNEKNDGAIYITENYKNLVASKYRVNSNNIVFPNYGLTSLSVNQNDFLPKLSKRNNKIHLIYIGLITQHDNKVRNMLNIFEQLSEKGFIIHVYPTRNKKYPEYRKISNLVMHNQLPVKELIKEITQYNLGIAILNYELSDRKKVDETRFGFWNKMFDYLMAGIPVLTLDLFEDMSEFVKMNEFGISFKEISELTPETLQSYDLNKIADKIVKDREKWTMENQIQKMIDFYQRTLENFHAKT